MCARIVGELHETRPQEQMSQASASAAPAESQLRRGLRLLEIIAREPRRPADIARDLGVNRSTAWRLLQELESMGYVKRDPSSKCFTSRPERFYSLMANHSDHWDIVDLVNPALATLREESAETALFAAPAHDSMIYISLYPSNHAITVRERIGTVRPMHSSAVGKAYLAALGPETLDRELGRLSYEGGTARAAKGPMQLRQRVDETRERGFAIDDEETLDGVCCVAAPVSIGGTLVGSIGISGPVSRLSPDIIERLGAELMRQVAAIDAP